MKNLKLFVVVALSVLVVGLSLVGVFGFNNFVDYSASYELEVSIDQRAGGATDVLDSAVSEYFEEKNIVPVAGSKQVTDKGMSVIYKFTSDVSSEVADIDAFVTAKLSEANITSVEVVAKLSQLSTPKGFDDWMILVSAGIIMVLIFVYALIMEKLSGALATLFSMALSVLTFVSLMGITRVPAEPFVVLGCLVASVIGGALSMSTVGRYSEEIKNTANEKLSTVELVNKLFNVEKKKYAWILAFAIVLAVAFILIGVLSSMMSYFIILGAQLAIAALSAIFSAYFGTPMIWSAVKKNK